MRIIKRKKGNGYYFYLQHSFRDDNKVISKEVYLGKKIPKNIEQIKQKLQQENKKDIYKKLEKIKKNFQKEWQKIPKIIEEKELQEIAIAFTYNTNAIEGSTITLSDTINIIKNNVAPNKNLNDIKETEAHYKLFLDMLNKKEKITNELLLRWHNEIFGETKNEIAGKYRTYLVRVGSYIAPDWQDVKHLMDNLIEFCNKSKLNPVELTAKAHYKFENIHPFGDGNGRVGRLLMNYILWHNKYPMIIIEKKKRLAYYKALQRGEEGFFKYFLKLYLRVHKRFV
ncbi:MAG: Fic family protein [Nanoarchaeota archaeon]